MMMNKFFLTGVLLIMVTFSWAQNTPVVSQDIFVSGENGYNTYRIPAIVCTAKGTLLAFCEGRKDGKSDRGDIDLLLKRSKDSGKTWSAMQTVWDDKDNTCGNPCPVVDQITGDIIMLSTWNLGQDSEKDLMAATSKSTRRVFVLTSSDDGLTWSDAREITDQTKRQDWRWYATGPGVGIQLRHGEHKGRLVIPANHSFPEYFPQCHYGAHVIFSDDHGKTWKYSDSVQPGLNETQMVELSDGTLMLNMRNYKYRGRRAFAWSDDGGMTWPRIDYKTSLVEPRCQGSTITLEKTLVDGEPVVLFANPNSETKRVKMTVRASTDDCQTWPIAQELFPGPSAYSSLVELADGRIGCFYECGTKQPYEKITLALFSYDWLKSK